MDVRASIFRMTVSGNAFDGVGSQPGEYLDFDALSYGPDVPLYFNTGAACNTPPPGCPDQYDIKDGETGTIPPDYDCPAFSTPMSYRAFAHLAPHLDTGYADCFMSVFANASDPDSIQRLVRFHSPVECTGTGEGPQDAKNLRADDWAYPLFAPHDYVALSQSGIHWFNTHGVYRVLGSYFADGQERTIQGHIPHTPSSTDCFQGQNFKEYQYPVNHDELHPWITVMGDGGNSPISGWVNPCKDINLMVSSVDGMHKSLEYEPIRIKFQNNSDLPTFFTVSAGKGASFPGKGFGVVAPDAAGNVGSKGEYDVSEAFLGKFTFHGHPMFRDGADLAHEPNIYPHASGFVDAGATSTEYLIDSSFDYFVVEVLRSNGMVYGTNHWYPGLMVQDAWLVGNASPFVEDWWKDGFPISGKLSRHGTTADIYPFGKLVGHDSTTASISHHPKWHDKITTSMPRDQNILVTYGESKTKIDTLTASVNSATIPAVGDGTQGYVMIDAPINSNINFGPYTADHLLFDLVSGVACMETANWDFTSQAWDYCYQYMNPFHNGSMGAVFLADMYGGFVVTTVPDDDKDNWITRGGSWAGGAITDLPWHSGFNMGASGWESPPDSVMWPHDQSAACYQSTNRNLAAGIQSVHDIRDAEPTDVGGYNLWMNGPYLRESLFEMAIQSGTSIGGYIEGLQTLSLGAVYDGSNNNPPNDPLIGYSNVFEAEPISIDVYKVEKTLTVSAY